MGLNRPIVISSAGMKAMQFSSDLIKWAKENGIRDPFEVSGRLFSKRVKEYKNLHFLIEYYHEKSIHNMKRG